jgi:two-component sensor histidine kinase/ABC-type amino acid transport substrate-binding protein
MTVYSMGLFAFLTLFAIFANAPLESQTSSTHVPLVFVGNRSLPPMVYDDGGRPKGIVVDIVKRLAVEMGTKIEVRTMDWAEAQSLVERGGADALIQINETPERLKVFDFSGPLLDSKFSIFTTSRHLGIADAEGLRGLKVGVEAKGFPQLALRSDPLVRLIVIPTILDGFRQLESGGIDALVVDEWVGQYTLAMNHIGGIFATGEPIAVSRSAIAVRKGDAELLRAIDAGLAAMRADGSYRAILERWRPKSIVYETHEQIHQRIRDFAFVIALLLLVFFIVFSRVLYLRIAEQRRYAQKLKEEAEVRAQLQAKELILKEVHHRIKNNMSTVAAMLSLQAQYAAAPRVAEALNDARSRIASMMVLYDRLYRRSNYESMSLSEYLDPLVDEIVANFPHGRDVRVVVDVEDCELSAKRLQDIGMVVNEVLTNAMKHAFAGIAAPEIRIASRLHDGRLRLSIADNGSGMPESADPGTSSGFGMTLIRELTHQMNGTLEIVGGKGTEVVLDIET